MSVKSTYLATITVARKIVKELKLRLSRDGMAVLKLVKGRKIMFISPTMVTLKFNFNNPEILKKAMAKSHGKELQPPQS